MNLVGFIIRIFVLTVMFVQSYANEQNRMRCFRLPPRDKYLALFWNSLQRRMAIPYRRFATAYWSHIRSSRTA